MNMPGSITEYENFSSSARRTPEDSSVYNQSEFWQVFNNDLQNAKAQVIISSPFFSSRQVKALAKDLRRLTNRGVVVCLFVQSPAGKTASSQQQEIDFAIEQEERELALRILQLVSVHVTFVKNIHEKFAIIDGSILWEGSLNIMSFFNTNEHMRRWSNKKEAAAIREKYRLDSCTQCMSNAANSVIRGDGSVSGAGNLLRMHRTRLGLSQRQLAAKSRIAQSRVWQAESGENLTLGCLRKLTQQLELELVLVPKLFAPTVADFVRRLDDSLEG
jgi:hypothetical protein